MLICSIKFFCGKLCTDGISAAGLPGRALEDGGFARTDPPVGIRTKRGRLEQTVCVHRSMMPGDDENIPSPALFVSAPAEAHIHLRTGEWID